MLIVSLTFLYDPADINGRIEKTTRERGFFVELLMRFELMTSSLPRMRATNCAIVADFQLPCYYIKRNAVCQEKNTIILNYFGTENNLLDKHLQKVYYKIYKMLKGGIVMDKQQDTYHVSLNAIIDNFKLEKLYMPKDEVMIYSMEVNRPGLPLVGYFDLFDPLRIEILGLVEWTWLSELPNEKKVETIDRFLSHHPAAVIFTRGLEIDNSLLCYAEKYSVPVLRTSQQTSQFVSALITYLNNCLAPRVTRHGVFVEVYGEGMLIMGESGIGKSETAIELVKRGHRFIADDVVEIRKVSSGTLIGRAPELLRHYVELRGIGIVDIHRIFGMGSVKLSEKIDLVVCLEPWDSYKSYDRIGLETEYMEIMGVNVPKYTIPVHPGRNLAVIMEIAAMNHRQKKMGYNTAEEFNARLMERATANEDEKESDGPLDY